MINDNLIEEVLNQANINCDINVSELSKEEIYKLAHTLKNLEFSVSGYKDEDSGQITCGGVDTDEINPSTMESKKLKICILLVKLWMSTGIVVDIIFNGLFRRRILVRCL